MGTQRGFSWTTKRMNLRLACVLAVVAAVVCLSGTSEGVYFYMRESADRCFTDEWEVDYLVHGEYEIAPETVTPQRIHEFPFGVVIKAPSGTIMFEREQDFSGRFGFTTTERGVYSICFNLARLPRSRKGSGRKVSLDIAAGFKTEDYTEVTQKEQLDPMTSEVRKMAQMAHNIKTEMKDMRAREIRHRATNESTNSAATWWSIVGLTLVLSLTAFQLYFVRSSVKNDKMF